MKIPNSVSVYLPYIKPVLPLVAVLASFLPFVSTKLHQQYCCKYTCPILNQGCPLIAVSTSSACCTVHSCIQLLNENAKFSVGTLALHQTRVAYWSQSRQVSLPLHRQDSIDYCCKYTCPTLNQGCPLVAVLTSS